MHSCDHAPRHSIAALLVTLVTVPCENLLVWVGGISLVHGGWRISLGQGMSRWCLGAGGSRCGSAGACCLSQWEDIKLVQMTEWHHLLGAGRAWWGSRSTASIYSPSPYPAPLSAAGFGGGIWDSTREMLHVGGGQQQLEVAQMLPSCFNGIPSGPVWVVPARISDGRAGRAKKWGWRVLNPLGWGPLTALVVGPSMLRRPKF